MTTIPQPPRERQALEEIGRTAVSRITALALAGVVLASIAGVALVDLRGGSPTAAVGELVRGVRAAVAATGLRPSNVALQEAIHRAEGTLEDGSILHARLRPWVQWGLTAGLGAGNESAYPGMDGTLFYRDDVDHVVGPPFLDAEILAARRRAVDPWVEPRDPDPLPALVDLRDQLAERGIELLLVPTPVKPSVHPEWFAKGPGTDAPALRNPSWGDFTARLRQAGIAWVDAAPALREAAAGGEALYLREDTHWSPAGLAIVADRVADEIARRLPPPGRPVVYRSQPVVVEAEGDTVRLLGLPESQRLYPPERTTVQRIVTTVGRSWRPDPAAEILLLGDSFTNIYSDEGLGWGTGAGLAEQLSFRLRRPLDRVAVNAGGAFAARRRLVDDPVGDRLAGKKIVVYQFATRELSQGDWRPLRLP